MKFGAVSMVTHDSKKDQLRIEIPINNLEEATKYRDAVLRILSRITIDPHNRQLKQDLKLIYNLLAQFKVDNSLNPLKGS